MSNLFTATIIQNEPIEYLIHNEDDVYVFEPTDPSSSGKTFKIKRHNDQWVVEGNLNDIAKDQAIAQLERFLLQQH